MDYWADSWELRCALIPVLGCTQAASGGPYRNRPIDDF
jgi:hypothetical protein